MARFNYVLLSLSKFLPCSILLVLHTVYNQCVKLQVYKDIIWKLLLSLSELSSNPSLVSILIPAHARSQASASTPTNASATTG